MSVFLIDRGALWAGCSMYYMYYMYCYWALEMIMGTTRCCFPSIYLHVSWIRVNLKKWTFNLIFMVFTGVCFVNDIFCRHRRNEISGSFINRSQHCRFLVSGFMEFAQDRSKLPAGKSETKRLSDKNAIFTEPKSDLDHNDPLKPSHSLTNGPEPSKTIESDGSKI